MPRKITRPEQIIIEFAAELGLDFPTFESYPDFTAAQQYIAFLAQNIASAESLVETAVAHVKSNADGALRSYANTNGVIQASGPLLDTYVAVLAERRSNLSIAMRIMLPAAPAPAATPAVPGSDDVTCLVQDIFARRNITDASIAALPDIVADIVQLVNGIAEATADGVAANLDPSR